MDTTETHTQTRAAAQEIIPGRNGGTLTPFDPARARAAQVKSVQSRRNRAMRAAQDRTVARLAASDNTITSWADAWGEMVADQAEALRQAASEGKPRGDDLVQVGQALGAMPTQFDARAEAVAHVQAETPRLMLLLAEAVMQWAGQTSAPREIVDGQVVSPNKNAGAGQAGAGDHV